MVHIKRLVLVILALHLSPCTADILVQVHGLTSELERNARAYMGLTAFGHRPGLSEATVRQLYNKAPQEIRAALQPFGYFEPAIEASLTASEKDWVAVFDVQLGTPVIVRDVDIVVTGEGRLESAFRDIIAYPLLRPGDVLVQSLYEDTKDHLLSAANERGYLDAEFKQKRLEVDVANNSALLSIVFATGSRYRFGALNIQQSILKDRLMRGYVDIQAGDYYDQNKLLTAQYALHDSDYFSWVEVLPKKKDQDTHTVAVEVNSLPAKRQRYAAGVGYSSDTRFHGLANWKARRINKLGHKGDVKLTVSSKEESLSGQYIVPGRRPITDHSELGFAGIREQLADTTSRRLELGYNNVRQLGRWQRKLSLSLNREQSELPDREQNATLLMPGISYFRSEQDAVLFPRRGKKFLAELVGSHERLGSDTHFLQLRLRASLIYPIAKRYRVLLRGDLGMTAVDNFSQLHLSQRFFAGGDRSIRGFSQDKVSALDEMGNTVGGAFLKLASVEVDRRIADKWALAAFVDAGGAVEEFNDELEFSVGLGVRWQTPVGMLRLDVAKPVTEGGESPRFHLSFSPDL